MPDLSWLDWSHFWLFCAGFLAGLLLYATAKPGSDKDH